MTLRIERRRSGDTLIVQLMGEFDVEHLAEVKAQVNDAPCPVVVDIGELTLISVAQPLYYAGVGDPGGPIMIDSDEILTELKTRLNGALLKEFAHLPVQRVAELGDPARVITDFAHNNAVDHEGRLAAETNHSCHRVESVGALRRQAEFHRRRACRAVGDQGRRLDVAGVHLGWPDLEAVNRLAIALLRECRRDARRRKLPSDGADREIRGILLRPKVASC